MEALAVRKTDRRLMLLSLRCQMLKTLILNVASEASREPNISPVGCQLANRQLLAKRIRAHARLQAEHGKPHIRQRQGLTGIVALIMYSKPGISFYKTASILRTGPEGRNGYDQPRY